MSVVKVSVVWPVLPMIKIISLLRITIVCLYATSMLFSKILNRLLKGIYSCTDITDLLLHSVLITRRSILRILLNFAH